MRNKFLILLGILFFLSGCRPVGVTVYLFPDTKESAKVRNYLLGTISEQLSIEITGKEKISVYSLPILIERIGAFQQVETCDGDRDEFCISLRLNETRKCMKGRGILRISSVLRFSSGNKPIQAPSPILSESQFESNSCHFSSQTVRSGVYASIEHLVRSVFPRRYFVRTPLNEFFTNASGNERLGGFYSDFLSELSKDPLDWKKAEKILLSAEAQFPQDFSLLQNIGTIYIFQGEWILGCKYFSRSIEFGKSEMLFRWLDACENFEFKEILR
ncbi:lipoprotein [Leptospira wolffii]|uniref:lipoprotein n=1 Tax=Leptospira wolffii TaxID=409998 RepID=UPI0002F404B6|nr:lipoprotein [Leptospira wolffii]EPG66118.1 putative lipoprotein [Leptospira wolffii serovar Khorat str. Khorat-H2]